MKSIKALRKETGLTPAMFAEKLKVSRFTLASYENGRLATPKKRLTRAKEIIEKIKEI